MRVFPEVPLERKENGFNSLCQNPQERGEVSHQNLPEPIQNLINWVQRIYQASIAPKTLRENRAYQKENLADLFKELTSSDFMLSEALASLEESDIPRMRKLFEIYLQKVERLLNTYQKNSYEEGEVPPNLYFTSFLAKRILDFQMSTSTNTPFSTTDFQERIERVIQERENQHARDLAQELRRAFPKKPQTIMETADIGAKYGVADEALEGMMLGKLKIDSYDIKSVDNENTRKVEELDILDKKGINTILTNREGKKYDSVILSNILHKLRLDDQRRALENAGKLADIIILVVPNMDDPVTDLLSTFDGSTHKQEGSIRTDQLLRTQVIAPAGFEIEHSYDLNGRVSLLDGFYHRMYKLRKKKRDLS